MQVLVFTDRDPAQSPQRRLRHLMGSGATLERLRRMRDQPDIIDHGAVHRRERLDKLHDCDAAQSRRGYERIARHRLGRLCVEAPEVNDAGQTRRPIADDFHQASDVISIAGAHAEARCIALLELCAVHDLDDGVSAFSQLEGQLRSDAPAACGAVVGEQQPGSRFRGSLRRQCRRCGQLRATRENQRMLSVVERRAIGDADRAAESGVMQQALPAFL